MVRRQERGNTTDGMTQSTSIPLNREMYIEDCIDGSRNLKIGDGIHPPKDLPNVSQLLRATNLIKNGNLSNGTTGWVNAGDKGVISVENGVLTDTITEPVQWNGISYVVNNENFLVKNHKCYISYCIKPFKTITPYFYINRTLQYFKNTAIKEEWTYLSKIVSFDNIDKTGLFQPNDSDNNVEGVEVGCKTSYKNFLAIDLTETFDLGCEPTKEQMDWLMSQFPNNWFDGTKTLIDFKVMIKFIINFLKT